MSANGLVEPSPQCPVTATVVDFDHRESVQVNNLLQKITQFVSVTIIEEFVLIIYHEYNINTYM